MTALLRSLIAYASFTEMRKYGATERAGEAIRKMRAKLPSSELKEVASAWSRLPTWMTQEISALVTHG